MAATDIAIVGMGCRLPGAPDLAAFWRLLRDGREARRTWTDDELRARGVPAARLCDPHYVKAGMPLADIEWFDAGFFGLSPHDAALFDPQHRVWLELCHAAFEHAGHVPDRFPGRIGVFAGCGMDTYLLRNVLTNPQLVEELGMFVVRHTGNDKDFLATRTSYHFDLRGPSVNVLTACSTSLVAVHQAMQSLLAGECDLALAGGVTIVVPQDRGYRWRPGEVLSPDGHCRAFDADARGTVFGSGAGVVVLRRLADALADGDRVHAVLKSSAINNDGARKVGYLAPSVDGYAECVAEALTLADVPAEQVQYIEAHGTGTLVGDPIEIAALTQAFRATTAKNGFCGIGSVKTNLGHLDTAAGVAGLLKVVLAMQHGELPASLHFRSPNPRIDFAASPFRLVARAENWPRPAGGRRLAGVSSLGVGGTNAHVVVAEAPAPTLVPRPYPRRLMLLPVSGKVPAAAHGNAAALACWLAGDGESAELADVAWTLQVGRTAFAHRAFVVGAEASVLARALAEPAALPWAKANDREPSLVFLFPGGGAQHPGMAARLFAHEPEFQRAVEACLLALPADVATAVRAVLLADGATVDANALQAPRLALPALFVVEYALARTLQSFGLQPAAMLGHSLGEYVAACLGGTFTVAQALQVVGWRAELFAATPPGAMLSVALPAEQALRLGADVSVAAANAPQLTVLAGACAAIDRVERELVARGVECKRVPIAVAAHSHLLDPHLARFREQLRTLSLQAPERPWISNVTGDWIAPERAVDADYWVEHLRRTVLFERGVATLLAGGERVFVEVGPGQVLSSLVRAQAAAGGSQVVATLPHARDERDADAALLHAVGRLWQLGADVDWVAFHGGGPRRRVPLPTYAFQRQRHWIEPGPGLAGSAPPVATDAASSPPRLPAAEQLQRVVWQQHADAGHARRGEAWWVLGDDALATAAVDSVRRDDGRAVWLRPGVAVAGARDAWTCAFDDAAMLASVLQRAAGEHAPQRLLLTATATADAMAATAILLAVCQAFAQLERLDGLRGIVLTQRALAIADERVDAPGGAAAHGFLRVVAREFPLARLRVVDVEDAGAGAAAALWPRLAAEVERDDEHGSVALRAGQRWLPSLQPWPATVAGDLSNANANAPSPWRPRGAWLLTGGLGGIARRLAEHLFDVAQARLALVSRRPLPPDAVHDEWLALRPDDPRSAALAAVRALRARGAEVEVFAADVADAAAMAAVVQRVRERFGPLHGIVHAAGVLDDEPLLRREPARSAAVLRPKVLGADVLDRVTAEAPPEQFVLFGSTSALAGVPGQCDYAAANAALCSFAAWRRSARPGNTVVVEWGPWQGDGMIGGAGAGPAAPPWLGERREHVGATSFHATWAPATHWPVGEHRLRDGDCVLPGTAMLALLVAAAQQHAGRTQLALVRVAFPVPMAFPGDRARELEVTVRPLAAGHEVQLASSSAGEPRAVHARAVVGDLHTHDELLPVASLRARLRPVLAPTEGPQRQVEFGPRWRAQVAVGVAGREVLADVALPAAFAADLREHALHPALLDLVVGAGVVLARSTVGDALFVPVACDAVHVLGMVPERLVAHLQLVAQDERARWCTFDVVVAGPGGVVVLVLRGLQLYGVRGRFGEARGDAVRAAPALASSSAMPAARAHAPSRAAELAAAGLTAAEGFGALERVLAAGVAHAVVTPFDVDAAAAWLARPLAPVRSPAPVEGEPLAVAATAPRDRVERLLHAAFAQLLGTREQGIDGDFFELGGHSLLAVRLFARLHRELGVDLELATLLGAGTVRLIAVAVRRALGHPQPEQPEADAADAVGAASTVGATSAATSGVAANTNEGAAAKRTFQHLVPVQARGTRPKLFLVHGAGGNVLGFRELAAALGDDQPLYGLQARGVDGRSEPHDSIAAMADTYLAEILQMQPAGPYLLGGYSGGGVVAYEMAQRLRARGVVVPFVGMIDSPCPQRPKRSAFARTMVHLGELVRQGPAYPLGILKTKFERWSAARHTEQSRGDGPLPPEQRGFALQFAFERAFAQHHVAAYGGPVWLFRAEVQRLGARFQTAHDLGWAPFVADLRIEVCPGDHFSMCTAPNVETLCARLRAAMVSALDRARTGG
jgi:acyl transferase domain-containing protein/thioesterase domain-containing protein